MFQFARPSLPLGLLHDIVAITPSETFSQANGGQFIPGTYTQNSHKLYTNGPSLTVGQQIRDTYDGNTYTVKQELTHGPIHPMKRYVVEQKGVSASK